MSIFAWKSTVLNIPASITVINRIRYVHHNMSNFKQKKKNSKHDDIITSLPSIP